MVVAPQSVAHVVEQRHHHIGLAAPVAVRARRGLERMFEPAHRKAAEIAIEQLEMSEHAIGQALGEGHVFAADQRPVFLRAFLHLAELGALADVVRHLCGDLARSLASSTLIQSIHRNSPSPRPLPAV